MVQDCLSHSITWGENQAALLSHIKSQLLKSTEVSILTQPSNVKDKKKLVKIYIIYISGDDHETDYNTSYKEWPSSGWRLDEWNSQYFVVILLTRMI